MTPHSSIANKTYTTYDSTEKYEVLVCRSTLGISPEFESELFFLRLFADAHAWFNNVWVVMPEFLSSM